MTDYRERFLRRFACACRKHRGDFTLAGAEAQYPPTILLEPIHLDLALSLDLDEETISGEVTHTLEARATASELSLDAVGYDSLSCRAEEAIEWTYDGKKARIRWLEPVQRGERRTLTVSYRTTRPVAGLYFSKPTPLEPNAPSYAATDSETERARHWFPTVDMPSVRPTLEFHLRAKSRFLALANGIETGRDEHEDGTSTTHWRLDQRCPSYLTCIAVGEFFRVDDGDHGGKPIAYFALPPHSEENLRRSFGITGEMLAWIEERLGVEFPFPKYFQFAVPALLGAMENISLVAWDDFAVMDGRSAPELSWLVDQINVHEMAHSYFGDHVVCRDFAHAWLKEGWATYLETCWLEHKRGREEADYDFFENGEAYFDEADNTYSRPIMTRVFNTSWDMYDRHLYPGAAARLHTLRHEIGDALFWQATTLYLERFGGRNAETDDLRRVMEEVSGRSLVRFFEQWFRSAGYPALKVEFEYDKERAVGTFEVVQSQVADGGCVFELSLELGWTEDGEEPRLERVRIDGERSRFAFAMASDPVAVRVDPRARTLHKLEFDPGKERAIRQLGAEDVVGRILAGRLLLKNGRPANVARFGEAYRNESFWGVRVEWARGLARMAAVNGTCASLLAELVTEERDPLVLGPLFDAAGSVKTEAIAAAIRAQLDRNELSYYATASALRALGRQRQSEDFERFVAALSDGDFMGRVQNGGARALAASRDPRAYSVLAAEVPGASGYRRPTLALALGALAPYLEPREREAAIEVLVSLLGDGHNVVRLRAARALGTAKATSSTAALERFAKTLAYQEEIEVLRVVAGIRAAAKAQDAGEDVAALREALRALEKRVVELEARAKVD